MKKAKLEDTTLAAIMRDEIMNPAGGAELMLRCTIPHVKEAVVVDTGSVDGTREMLDRLEKEFPQLRVYDYKWDGSFADARNVSLDKVRTEKVLVLDADELLTAKDFKKLNKFIRKNPWKLYDFFFRLHYNDFNEPCDACFNVMPDRLFSSKMRYKEFKFSNRFGKRCEESLESFFPWVIPYKIARIKHFLPSNDAENNKNEHWYGEEDNKKISAKEHGEIYRWKQFNVQRLWYDFPDLGKHPVEWLRERGAEIPELNRLSKLKSMFKLSK